MKVDLRWKIQKSNQLWLKWKGLVKEGDGKVRLIEPEFYGPVLTDCAPIDSSGFINIDLTRHLIVLIPRPYIVRLSWDSLISQDTEKARFKEMVLEDTDLGHLANKLTPKDCILLDSTGHTTEEEARGRSKLSFEGMVYNSDMSPYDFSR